MTALAASRIKSYATTSFTRHMLMSLDLSVLLKLCPLRDPTDRRKGFCAEFWCPPIASTVRPANSHTTYDRAYKHSLQMQNHSPTLDPSSART